ncbi:MAG TPA: type II/IV secretion system protein [Candidatus Parcubacteria bacterium]|nr:type II/IV secretion system protein [Candidatus Parcubacteria bacterium]
MLKTKKITGEIKIPHSLYEEVRLEVKNIPDFKRKIESSLNITTSELTEVLLVGAIVLNASDIHIEPEQEEAKIRIRVDGVLEDVIFLDIKKYNFLLSRIKLMSGLKLNVKDRPQDGRFSILLEGGSIEIRASSLPAEYGESIVLRILNPKNLISLEKLGMREDLLKLFKKEIKRPHGMIIVTGPTGSGKTTTLYAILKKLNKPEVKIITIEDPIEYELKGISQSQVDPSKGYDFANGLKALMRQDPDVILVGEIRDLETAKIAIQAALTGHLVLTTLHTNDSAGVIARLQALGEKPVDIAPAINMAVAQRLVRKVCPKCKSLRKISAEELKEIKKELKNLPDGVKVPKIDKNTKIAEAKGCPYCNFTGYRGRDAIFEAFLVDEEIEEFILKSPSIPALRKLLRKKGMVSMRQDGLIKVLNNITTIEEVNRVTSREK